MPKVGDGIDVATAFAGAVAAGTALFLPFTFSAATAIDSPYRVTSLVNSVPRAAALGLIVAVVVAVLVRPLNRPGLVWLTAALAALVLAINYFIGRNITDADILTTQNYIDALSGGALFGALGVCALRRRWPAVGYAVGTVTVFVYGEVISVFSSNSPTAEQAARTPAWLLVVAVALLVVNTLRHRHGVMLPALPRIAADLPITPIVAATVLALSVLLASEWLADEFDGRGGNSWPIAAAAGATVLAAFVAALLLPARDGAWVMLAVAVSASADTLADARHMGVTIVAVLGLAAAGALIGLRWSSPWLVLLGAGVLCGYAAVDEYLPFTASWTLGTALLAFIAGYAFGAIRVSYLPSAVLGLGALYLPTVLWVIPTELRNWPVGGTPVSESIPGRAALGITVGVALGLALLFRIRPAAAPVTAEQ
ncbi:hypothetical protein ACFXK0_14675 [Nocardia sp. NPDC059177]|uniref:hypothetical protein n=1 Tax=Nocardia sp. NPDC059177 TaxID=3346759 RepID=UPI00369BA381